MASLLETFFSPENSQANMALFAGAMGGNLPQGLLSRSQILAERPTNELKRLLLKSQVDENTSQAELRKLKITQDARQQKMMEELFGGTGGQIGAVSPVSSPNPAQGGMGSPQPTGAAPSGGGGLLGLAAQLGIPKEAIQADMMFNGGKKIAEIINSRSTPKWENVNGNLVNTAQPGFQGGMQEGFKASDNGQVTMWRKDGNGNLVFSAPPGALDTYKAYQDVGEKAKSLYKSAGAVNLRKNADGTERPVSELSENPVLQKLLGVQQPSAQPGMSGNFGGSPEEIMAGIQAIRDPQERANALAAFNEQAGRTQGFGGGAPLSYGKTTAQEIADAAAKEKAVGQTKTDIVPTAQKQNALAQSGYLTSVIDRAIQHPGLSTGTGLQGKIDPRNYIPGTDATNFRTLLDQINGSAFLQAFEGLKGGGQITEVEGAKATAAIARLNRAQSTEEFVDALKEFRNNISGARTRLLGRGGITEDAAPANVVDTLPKSAPRGTRARDTKTGEIKVFNGLTWAKER